MLPAIVGFAALLVASQADAGPVLDALKARGQLVFGLGSPTAGFMQPDRQGKWSGFIDICRGVAAALPGDTNKMKFDAKRFPALLSGEVDMLASNSSWTLTRDAAVMSQAISKEPRSPVARHGDQQFTDFVRWVIFSRSAKSGAICEQEPDHEASPAT